MDISRCENSFEEGEAEEEWFYFPAESSARQASPSQAPDQALQYQDKQQPPQLEQERASQLHQPYQNIQQSQHYQHPDRKHEQLCQLSAHDEVTAQHEPVPAQDRPQASYITPPIMPHQILHCPVCRSGVLTEHFSAVGVLLAVFIFPVGIMFCLLTREWKCSQCGSVV